MVDIPSSVSVNEAGRCFGLLLLQAGATKKQLM
jgi:hypothetical protein